MSMSSNKSISLKCHEGEECKRFAPPTKFIIIFTIIILLETNVPQLWVFVVCTTDVKGFTGIYLTSAIGIMSTCHNE